MRPSSVAAASLSSISFRLPHFGLWTQEGQPAVHGHVLLHGPQRLGEGGPRGLALLEEPGPVTRPVPLEQGRPAAAGLELADRLERQHHSILNENGSGSGAGCVAPAEIAAVRNWRLIPSIQVRARSVSS